MTDQQFADCHLDTGCVSGNLVYWKCGGVGGSVVCANPLFTNALSTNGWNRVIPANCGLQIVSGVLVVVTPEW